MRFYLAGLCREGNVAVPFFNPPRIAVAACLLCGCAFVCYIFLVPSGQMPLSSASTVSQLQAA